MLVRIFFYTERKSFVKRTFSTFVNMFFSTESSYFVKMFFSDEKNSFLKLLLSIKKPFVESILYFSVDPLFYTEKLFCNESVLYFCKDFLFYREKLFCEEYVLYFCKHVVFYREQFLREDVFYEEENSFLKMFLSIKKPFCRVYSLLFYRFSFLQKEALL